MVNVPVYGPAGGAPFSWFDHELPANEDKKAFAAKVEEGAQLIIGKISDREYLARKVDRGTMPRLNRVLEELGIQHEEHVVPLEVRTTIEEKRKKAAAKNAIALVESKKRKGEGPPKLLPRNIRFLRLVPLLLSLLFLASAEPPLTRWRSPLRTVVVVRPRPWRWRRELARRRMQAAIGWKARILPSLLLLIQCLSCWVVARLAWGTLGVWFTEVPPLRGLQMATAAALRAFNFGGVRRRGQVVAFVCVLERRVLAACAESSRRSGG
jgi:hypothetical protein